jgi:hypothetical protein
MECRHEILTRLLSVCPYKKPALNIRITAIIFFIRKPLDGLW